MESTHEHERFSHRRSRSIHAEILPTDADIRTWLPGDNLYDDSVLVPSDMPPGRYDLQIGIIDPKSRRPKVQLAISGKQPDGWYHLGKVEIRK